MIFCCCNCTIGSDPLTASTDWTLTSCSIASGTLTMSGASTAFYTLVPTSAEDGVRLTLLPTNAAGTGVVRYIAGRSDSSNYAFGEINITTGVIRVGSVVGGSETIYGETETITDTGADKQSQHTTEFCWRPGTPQEAEPGMAALAPGTVLDNTLDWTLPEEAEVQDGTAATYIWGAGVDPAPLVAVDFSFDGLIPQDSTIDGIEAYARAKYNQGSSGDPPVISVSMQLTGPGGPTGSVKGPTALTTSYTDVAFGGAADLWGTGFDRDDVVHADFGVLVSLTHDDPSRADDASVDFIGISVYYTTPSRTRGTLQITFVNNGDSSITCARSYNVRLPTLGTGTGIEVVSGNWTFAAPYLLEYLHSTTRSNCPVCTCNDTTITDCSCCDNETGDVPEEMTIGTFPGFTGDCDACANFAGTYVVTHRDACRWMYVEQMDCGENIGCSGSIGAGSVTFDTVTLAITVEKISADGSCHWRATVALTGCTISDPSDPNQGVNGASAVYESANIDPATAECPELPLTLNRSTHFVTGICSGTFPATLTLASA